MRTAQIFFLLLIAVVGLIAYSNTFNFQFVYDDLNNITDNPLIRQLDNFIFPAGGYKGYLPRAVGFFTFALNYHFGGLNVTGYHVVNLIIHITNAILVYFLVVLTFNTPYFSGQRSALSDNPPSSPLKLRGDRGELLSPHFIALFSALLFVSHPLQTQAVTYIVQRLTSLATMFYLLSIVMYIKARLMTQKSIGNGLWVIGHEENAPVPFTYHLLPITYFSLSLLFAVLAMLTKEISFTLPLVIILYEFTFFRSTLKKKLFFVLPLLLTLTIIPLSIMGTDKPLGEILSDLSGKFRVQTELSRWDYLFTQFRVIVTYIRLLFFPVNQNLDYDYPVYHSFFEPPVYLSFLLFLSIVGIAVYLLYKTRMMSNERSAVRNNPPSAYPLPLNPYFRLVAFGIFWFFITLSVTSSVIPIVDVIVEHRVYLPSAGAFISISAIGFILTERLSVRLPKINKTAIPLFALIICVLSIVTHERNFVWKDELSLWQDVVEKAPRNARGHFNLGVAYNSLGMHDKAIDHLLTALSLNPDDPEIHYNLGLAYSDEGMTAQSIEQLKSALRLKPDFYEAHYDIAVDYMSLNLTDKAVEHLTMALKLQPNDPAAHNNLGIAYASKGEIEKAIEHFRAAIKLKPDFHEAYNNLELAVRSKK